MKREVMWVSLDGRVFEHLYLVSNGDGVLADGMIVHLETADSFRARYRIHCDPNWNIRKLELDRLDGDARSLVLHSDGKGSWTDSNGDTVAPLYGCRDLDIYYSPFTNTLAIRRLILKPGQSADIRVAFVTVSDMKVAPAQQRYTFLNATPQGGLYRYESGDFNTELPVDSDGLLIEYPKYFERVWTNGRRKV